MKTLRILPLSLVFLTSIAVAEPRYGRSVFTVSGSGAAQTSFKPDTPKIELHLELLGITSLTKISGIWVAEKTDAAPANFEIDTANLNAMIGMKEATFSLSKPDKGWPVGNYRVDLVIEGKKVGSLPFQVAN